MHDFRSGLHVSAIPDRSFRAGYLRNFRLVACRSSLGGAFLPKEEATAPLLRTKSRLFFEQPTSSSYRNHLQPQLWSSNPTLELSCLCFDTAFSNCRSSSALRKSPLHPDSSSLQLRCTALHPTHCISSPQFLHYFVTSSTHHQFVLLIESAITDIMSEHENTFDTAEMSAALSEAGSNAGSDAPKPVISEPPPIVPIEGAAERAREHGFAPPVAYDYDSYNTMTKEERDAAAAEGRYVEPGWAATAARYEWDDEYGDVGPEDPKLEEELFRHDNVMRKGNAFEVLEYKIHQEGPVQIAPIRKVCPHYLNLSRTAADFGNIVRGCRSSSCHAGQRHPPLPV